MARAAVKAKQQAKAKAAQPTKPRRRGRRGHSGGGNPNQNLFFVRLRRRQKWLFALLAVVFGVSFAAVGVGSGNGGLSSLYSGLFGGGGSSVSKAQGEIKKNPAKGYRDLATAYETKGDNVSAISALQSYLGVKKRDANVWTELGGLQTSQAQTYVTEYQQASQASQLADPSTPFQPGGTLAAAVGGNSFYTGAAQQASTTASTFYQQAIASLNGAVTSYQKAAKLQPRSTSAQELVATAASNAGNAKVAIAALKKVLKIDPHTPQRKTIEKQIKSLQKQLAPASKPKVTYNNSKSKSGK